MPGTIADPTTAFERVYCINLDARADRWRRFAEQLPADWPFPPPVREPAIWGKHVKHPEYWSSGGGAWGCYRSHLRLIEQCLNEQVRSVLILEDDALFPSDFAARVTAWLRHVPADWHMLYFGGQHLFAGKHPPIRIAPDLYQPYNVNRTHAYALQGDMLRIVYHHLLRRDWHARNHIDHHYGRLHQQRKHRIYCPGEWLVGQAGGKSSISGRAPPDRFWPAAEQISSEAAASLSPPKLVAILGLHSSGTSALCQALSRVGLWFGKPTDLIGYWGKNHPARGCEHKQLARILETTAPLAAAKHAKPRRWLWRQLNGFVRDLSASVPAGQLAAIKYPQLCQAGRQLRAIAGDGLRVIVCDRSIEESVTSLIRRTNADGPTANTYSVHQRWLAEGRDAIARTIPQRTLRVAYAHLLDDPAAELQRITAWLGLQPAPDQLAAAAADIDPAKQHVRRASA